MMIVKHRAWHVVNSQKMAPNNEKQTKCLLCLVISQQTAVLLPTGDRTSVES